MGSFFLGLVVGFIASPLILAAVSKPLMKWFAKRQINKVTENVMGRMGALQSNFEDLNNKKEDENNVKINKEEKTSSA